MAKLTRAQFERLIPEGSLAPDPDYELVHGELVVLPREGPYHYSLVHRLADILEERFGFGFHARASGELDIAPDEFQGNPAPDIAIVDGDRFERRYRDAHPKTAHLVVEVAHTTLERDRRKASIYARARIPEYWIVNVQDRSIEIYTDPLASPAGEFGWVYGKVATVRSGTVRPLAAKGEPLALDDIF